MRTRLIAALLALTALLVGGCGVTRDDASGTGRLTMVIPNKPGGGYDLTGRAAVRTLEDADLTARMQVENVVGASGTVAMARLLNQRGDPSVLMSMGLGVVGAVYTNKSDATASKMTPIARLIEESEGVIVPADSPYKNITELLAAWKASPRSITVGGGSAPGGPDHLFPMELAKAAGIDAREVNYTPYDGGGDLLPALLGSKVTMATSGLGEYTEQVKAGKVRVLAVSGEKRVNGIDAPTLKEAGVDLVFFNWRGILAPPDIPPARQAEFIEMVTKMHATPEWKKVLADHDWTDSFVTGEQFGTFLKEQDSRVAKTLTELGLV